MRLNGLAPRPPPPDEGERIRDLRIRHEERHPGGFLRIFPAALGSVEADLYQEVEAAAWRAHEQGEVKPAVTASKPSPATDSLRPQSGRSAGGGGAGSGGGGGASDWRSRASLGQLSRAQSPLSTGVSPSPWYRCVGGGVGAGSGRRRGAGDAAASCSLGHGAADGVKSMRSEPLDQTPQKSSRQVPIEPDSDEVACSPARPAAFGSHGCGGHGYSPTSPATRAMLAGLRARLGSSASSRSVATAERGDGRSGGGSVTRQSLGSGVHGLGPHSSFPAFAGEGWADVLPTVSHRAKRFRVQR